MKHWYVKKTKYGFEAEFSQFVFLSFGRFGNYMYLKSPWFTLRLFSRSEHIFGVDGRHKDIVSRRIFKEQ